LEVTVLLKNVKADLQDVEVIGEVEHRVVRVLVVRKPKSDSGSRIAELGREIENLAAAIANGLLRHRPGSAENWSHPI
jgi:hypothetical protein